MAQAGGLPAVDPSAFEELEQSVGDDREFLRDLVDTYIEDSPRQLKWMRAGLVSSDMERLHRAAHTLKSNSASLGAITLSEMCRDLEALSAPARAETARAAEPALEERVEAIASELERVMAELDALVPVEAA